VRSGRRADRTEEDAEPTDEPAWSENQAWTVRATRTLRLLKRAIGDPR
jgi:hypothetical protein